MEGPVHAVLAVPERWYELIAGSYVWAKYAHCPAALALIRQKWQQSGLPAWSDDPASFGWKGMFYREIGVVLTVECALGLIK